MYGNGCAYKGVWVFVCADLGLCVRVCRWLCTSVSHCCCHPSPVIRAAAGRPG